VNEGSTPLFESHVTGLELIHRGKVRDMYAVDNEHLLMVATDRLSAFDVVLPDPIPGKGEVLTALSIFWFKRMANVVLNHTTRLTVDDVVDTPVERDPLRGRSLVVRRVKPLPLEAIVRGYLIGSGWKDYQREQAVSGISLPAGLRQADRLPDTIFTPSTKGEVGEHDENVDFDWVVNKIGKDLADQVREVSLKVYETGAAYALRRGIIIADTKFEFGTDHAGDLVLIDEVLTPDSSRFWPVAEYQPGMSPPSFDKQFVRDWLERSGWDKQPPAPELPDEVVRGTLDRYREAYRVITGTEIDLRASGLEAGRR
jgi:phosphoribosylaminoimidazole-succinocarboxamide synthase